MLLPGVLAVCALPPFNGFVSEWLLYRGLFASIANGGSWSAGFALFALALTGGLAGVAFATFYGFIFLGLPRSEAAGTAQEVPAGMGRPMAILAGLCLALSLGGILLLGPLDRVLGVLAPGNPAMLALGLGAELALFAGLATLLLVLGAGAWLWLKQSPVSARPGTWDCGYVQPTARMQYSASSFSAGWAVLMPGWKLRVRRIRELFPRSAALSSGFRDAVGEDLVAVRTDRVAMGLQRFRRLQEGHLSMYLLYILLTLVLMFLWLAVRP